jgi:mRNA interferase RelE/StbE
MAKYEIRFKASVAKDLKNLANRDIKLILQRIDALIDEPRPRSCEKLSAQERYRIRQGIYRIIYEIRDKELVVIVIKIEHRREHL